MHVTLHLTTGCNLDCDYCYSPPRERVDMSPRVALKAVDLALSDGRESASIVFFGGEPLLRKDLIALCVAYAIEQGRNLGVRPRFKVTTNGLLLDDAFNRFCADTGIAVAISLDGCREAHDAHRHSRSGRSSYDLVVERCRAAIERHPYALALTVVSPDTVRHLDRSIATILDMGFRYAIVSLDYSGPWDDRSIAELREGYEEVSRQYALRTRREEKFYLSPFETRIASHVRPETALEERCHLGVRQVSVAPDGSIYPCVQFTRAGPTSEFVMGHVDRGIDHERRTSLYGMSRAEPRECERCAIRGRCNHTCSCLNWQCTGTICGVPPILCEHERLLLPIADRVAGQLFKERSPMFLHKHYNAAYPLASLIEDLERSGSFLP